LTPPKIKTSSENLFKPIVKSQNQNQNKGIKDNRREDFFNKFIKGPLNNKIKVEFNEKAGRQDKPLARPHNSAA
jgi:hypothetical protein